jgi:hypothetical protein
MKDESVADGNPLSLHPSSFRLSFEPVAQMESERKFAELEVASSSLAGFAKSSGVV